MTQYLRPITSKRYVIREQHLRRNFGLFFGKTCFNLGCQSLASGSTEDSYWLAERKWEIYLKVLRHPKIVRLASSIQVCDSHFFLNLWDYESLLRFGGLIRPAHAKREHIFPPGLYVGGDTCHLSYMWLQAVHWEDTSVPLRQPGDGADSESLDSDDSLIEGTVIHFTHSPRQQEETAANTMVTIRSYIWVAVIHSLPLCWRYRFTGIQVCNVTYLNWHWKDYPCRSHTCNSDSAMYNAQVVNCVLFL